MAKSIKIRISGHGAGTDAPTADDVLAQISDYLAILRGVETAIAEDGQIAIEWRIVNASKSSPLEIELGAFSRQYAVNVDRRTEAVTAHTAQGLATLRNRAERPPFFTDRVLERVRRACERVTNGLDLSAVEFGDGLPRFEITQASARQATTNARIALNPVDKPYREIGTIEGVIEGTEIDGHGRRVLVIKNRLTGASVKCFLSGEALEIVQDHRIREVYLRRRVRVFGTAHYRSLGRLSEVHVTRVEFARPRAELPSVDDIIDPNFTGGLRSEEYLDRLRDGRLA